VEEKGGMPQDTDPSRKTGLAPGPECPVSGGREVHRKKKGTKGSRFLVPVWAECFLAKWVKWGTNPYSAKNLFKV